MYSNGMDERESYTRVTYMYMQVWLKQSFEDLAHLKALDSGLSVEGY